MVRLVFGTGFRNINNAGVKIAFFTGQTFINSVGNNVGDPPPVVFGGGERLSFKLVLGINVPQAKFNSQMIAVNFRNGALNQSMGINSFPVYEVWLFVDRGQRLDIAPLGNDFKQAGAL